MSKINLSAIPRRNLLWGVLGLVVAVGLGWKMTADYFTARAVDAASPRTALAASATPRTPVEVSGFRSAKFGDDEAAVRAAIVKDFAAKDGQIREAISAVQKTKLLAVRVKDVVANSGVAEVVYIFGYASKRLMQVNVVWNSQFAADMSPARVGATANVLGNYFANQGFVPSTVTLNQKLPNGAVRVFNGRDKDGRLVTLIFREAVVKEAASAKPDDKAKADKSKDAKAKGAEAGQDDAKTKRIALLRLSYVENSNDPDVFKITEGNF
jgi:hypothetical protein